MIPILKENLAKRSIDLKALKLGEKSISNNVAYMSAEIIQGVNQDIAREIVKCIKSSKIKVQSAIQGDCVRVTGKKRDELQDVISLLKKNEIEIPLQFVNFRDWYMSWLGSLKNYFQPRILLVAALGFLSGLPLGLLIDPLNYWLAEIGINKSLSLIHISEPTRPY